MGAGLPFTALAASLPSSVPFVGPETQERARGAPFRVRLGANESPFGPSPHAVAAMRGAAADTWKYGDPENHDLREALAAHHGVAPARIGIGEGIDGLLQVIVRLFAGPGAPVVTSKGAYPTLLYHVAGFGAVPVFVPYVDDREDPDSLLAAVRETGAPLVYLANPDNPMGTWHDAGSIARFIEALPEPTVLMLDEAYGEFAPLSAALPMDYAHPRLIRLRTFSKAYGMAGARVGYAVTSPEIATAFDKVRNHFGVNRIAQAGALAALVRPGPPPPRRRRGRRRTRCDRRHRRPPRPSRHRQRHQLRRARHRPRRRLLARTGGGAGGRGRLRAHAVRRAAGPLHPHQRGPRRNARHLRGSTPGRPRPRRSVSRRDPRRLSVLLAAGSRGRNAINPQPRACIPEARRLQKRTTGRRPAPPPGGSRKCAGSSAG